MNKYGTMEITTVIGCNIRCMACPQEKMLKSYFHQNESRPSIMTMETFKKCIDSLPNDIRIDFSGMAEPWLNRNCSEMLSYVAEKGHPIAVYTTLVGMNFKDVDIIIKYNYEDFVIHVPDCAGNTKIPITDEYIEILKKLLSAKQCGGRQVISGISCHGKLHEKLSFLENVSDIYYINELHDRAGNVESEELELYTCKVNGQFRCIECGIDLNHNVLLPDGTVLLCCMDYGMKHIMGNLLNDSYEMILSGAEHERVARGMDSEKEDILCRKCYNARDIDGIYAEFRALRGRYKNTLK